MKAVLDANVLYPTILREILIAVAQAGLYVPLWSARILDEWRRAAARLGPDQDRIAGSEIALLREAFSAAQMPYDGQRAIDLDLPDPSDRHVIEAALAGDADMVVTANLSDFPRYVMHPLGLRAIHPDAFLLQIHQADTLAVFDAAQRVHDKAIRMGGQMSLEDMLKRSRLPRLAKALKAKAPKG